LLPTDTCIVIEPEVSKGRASTPLEALGFHDALDLRKEV
jgi:hypothetical protein